MTEQNWLQFAFIRLRFVAILAVIGIIIVKWEWLNGYYDKLMRSADADTANQDVEYYCAMHPGVVSENKRDKCPICFMNLSKRKKGAASEDSLPAGVVSRVELSPYRIVLAGARTMPVTYQTLVKEIAMVGNVEFDERDLFNVSSRVKGRIDKLFVNQTGQLVAKGDPLALLYSPDLVITAQNLLDAIRSNNSDLQKIARDRLKLWGVDNQEIDEIAASGKPITQITIRSPISGHVIRKYQRQGQYVDEGATLYDVADISKVWVQAQFYEEDLAFLPKGSHDPKTGGVSRKLDVVATTRAFPGREFKGILSFIFPHVDQDTRTLTVRFELDNQDHELRPGMSATVTLKLTAADLADLPAGAGLKIENGKILAVSEASVIDTGKIKVVYKEELPGTFDGVEVTLGSRMSGPKGEVYFPVLSGLSANEIVVTAGSFLIDAETRLNPAMNSIYIGGSSGKSSPSATTIVSRPSDKPDPDEMIERALKKVDAADRAIAVAQKWCPIQGEKRLGEMGVPVKVKLEGKDVFLCCKGCVDKAESAPTATLARIDQLKQRKQSAAELAVQKQAKIRAGLALLPQDDRILAEAQRFCPKTQGPLGSMGMPPKLMINGRAVFTCCEDCNEDVAANPDETLKKIDQLKTKTPKK